MRIPVPRNRLVALTLVGVVLTGGLSVALASPALIPDADEGADDGDPGLAADAPAPNENFTPDVRSQYAGDDESEEHEEYEEYGEYDNDDHDDESEEHEEDDD